MQRRRGLVLGGLVVCAFGLSCGENNGTNPGSIPSPTETAVSTSVFRPSSASPPIEPGRSSTREDGWPLSLVERDSQARWVALAHWRKSHLKPVLSLKGASPSLIENCVWDEGSAPPVPAPVKINGDLGSEVSRHNLGTLALVFDRPDDSPWATPVVDYGMIRLSHFMQLDRTGVVAAPPSAVYFALRNVIPRNLKGRSVRIYYPPLNGTRRKIDEARLIFVAEEAPLGITICKAAAMGPLYFLEGYYAEGDTHGSPIHNRYAGFQILFWRDEPTTGQPTEERYEDALVVSPKSALRGRCTISE